MRRKPTSPGEILNEEFLKPLGMTQKELAVHLDCDYKVINRIINERANVTPEMAVKLYQKRCQTWNLVRQLRKFFCLERATIVRAQGASEDKKFAATPTQPNSKFDTVSGISMAFNTSPDFWLNAQRALDLYIADS